MEEKELMDLRLAILLDSIKFPNNFVLKKSNNLFKSNKTTNFNQKKLILNRRVYVSYYMYDSLIRYAPIY